MKKEGKRGEGGREREGKGQGDKAEMGFTMTTEIQAWFLLFPSYMTADKVLPHS